MTIGIDAVKRLSLWLFAHIGEKGGKRLLPSFADLNTSLTVIFIMRMTGVGTPSVHSGPRVISRTDAVGGMTVFGTAVNQKLQFGAAARADTVRTFKRCCLYQTLIPTRAPTKPSCLPSIRIRPAAQHRPSAKLLAGKINQQGHIRKVQQIKSTVNV